MQHVVLQARPIFRLRTLFIAMAALCAVLGYFGRRWAVLQAEVDAALKLNTTKHRDWRNPPRHLMKRPSGWGVFYPNPAAIDGMHVGFISFYQPVSVDEVLAFWRSPPEIYLRCARQKVTDPDLRLCNSFRNIRSLAIVDVDLTDRQFALITATKNLQGLLLCDNPLHDVSAQRIAQMRSIRYLDLTGTEVTDAGICHLTKLPHLEELFLNNNGRVTDRGVQCLSDCHSLRCVQLEHTKITDVALANLARLPALVQLSLRGTNITDRGVRHLVRSKSCPTITRLLLSDTKVTDEVIPVLRQFPNLSYVELNGTLVDVDRAKEFTDYVMRPRINRIPCEISENSPLRVGLE